MVRGCSDEEVPRSGRTLIGAIVGPIYLFLILPTVIVVAMSFGNKYELMFPPNTFSFYLYEQLFGGNDWLVAMARSARIALGTAVCALLLGIPAAYGLTRGRFAGRNLVLIFLLSPLMIPSIVLALGLYLYFSYLRILGSDLTVLLGHCVIATPFVIVIAMAALRDVDENLELASGIMGAGPVQTLINVTLPLMRPAIFAGGLFAFLASFDEVVIAYFLSGNAAMTLPVKMFSSIRWEISPVLAAAATFLTLISMAICLVAVNWQKRTAR